MIEVDDKTPTQPPVQNRYYLCQYNVARAVAELTDPQMTEFVAGHDLLYSVSEHTPGFVWRLQGDGGHGSVQPFTNDPRLLVGLSVWDSVEALRSFVYGALHAEFLRKRRQWFERPSGPNSVLWWIPAGELPTIVEGARRLALLATNGPSPAAFTFQRTFGPPTGVLGTLGPEGTNSEKAAREYMHREGLENYDLRLYDTFEEVADGVVAGRLDRGLICTAYLKFSAVYFERAPKLLISESFVAALHPMVIASVRGASFKAQLKFACQPAILPLVVRFLNQAVVVPAASNASAALDVAAGRADICMTTETAANSAHLEILVRMPPLEIPFAIIQRSGLDVSLPRDIVRLFGSGAGQAQAEFETSNKQTAQTLRLIHGNYLG
jgi:hypothetical protein